MFIKSRIAVSATGGNVIEGQNFENDSNLHAPDQGWETLKSQPTTALTACGDTGLWILEPGKWGLGVLGFRVLGQVLGFWASSRVLGRVLGFSDEFWGALVLGRGFWGSGPCSGVPGRNAGFQPDLSYSEFALR